MNILKTLIASSTIAVMFLQTGCQTTKQAEEAKAESDAKIAAAQAETEAVRAEMEEALATAKAEAAEAVAAAEAEKAEMQTKLEEAMAEDEQQERAAREIPGSTLTADGTLLFKAKGQSVAEAEEGAAGLAKARMAAETIAKAKLLEVIKGGLISSSVSVGDMMFQSQQVSSEVSGWLGGVVVETESTQEKASHLPDAEPVDQIVTATASLEISLSAWQNLQEYVE